MVVTFNDIEQLRLITGFVNVVSGIYSHSAVSTISQLAEKLKEAYAKNNTKVELIEDPTDNYDNDQVVCLYNICGMLCNTDADDYNAAAEVQSMLKKHCTKSDVPRFLEVLRDYHVPAEYCVGLFSDWCSGEGTASMAEKCMDIQATRNIIMTPVWEWLCNNYTSPDTDYREEVNRFKEAIND